MGCCGSGGEKMVERHETGFLKIKLLVDEISEILDHGNQKINPTRETLSSFMNHLNFLIQQELEFIHQARSPKDLNSLKSITEDKLNTFSTSLINLCDFIKSSNDKLWTQASPEFLANLKDKMKDIQWNLKELLNQAIVVVFPTIKNKNQALMGIYKKDFDAIFDYFHELFKFIEERKKDVKIDLVNEFTSIISCFFWLNNFCLEGDQKYQFREFTNWLHFKTGFEKFVKETMQMELSENELIGIKTALDTLQNNYIYYRDWDNFFSKTWSNFRKKGTFLKNCHLNNEETNLSLMLMAQCEGKTYNIQISEKYFEINGEIHNFVNENYLLSEAVSIGNSEVDQIKLDTNVGQSLFKINIANHNNLKTFFIINENEKNPIKFLLNEMPYLLTSGFCATIEDRYFIEIGNFEINPQNIDLNLYKLIMPFPHLEQNYNENRFKPELIIKIIDKVLNKEKEYELNVLNAKYKIYYDVNNLTITPKEVELARVYCEINYLSEKKLWILQKSSASKSKLIQILPFSLKTDSEKIIYGGQMIENGLSFSAGGMIFRVIF